MDRQRIKDVKEKIAFTEAGLKHRQALAATWELRMSTIDAKIAALQAEREALVGERNLNPTRITELTIQLGKLRKSLAVLENADKIAKVQHLQKIVDMEA
jgi:hypothetical protein